MINNCDCIDFLRELEDESVDLILTDPPYSSGGFTRSDRSMSTRKKYQSTNAMDVKPVFFGDNRDQRSLTLWLYAWMREGFPKVKQGGMMMCFIDWRNIACMIDAGQMAGYVYQGIVPWIKPNARPMKGIFRNQCEYVVCFVKGATPQIEIYAEGYFSCMPQVAAKRLHSTEKPVELLQFLMQFVPEGGYVVDPFAGSGSTGEAAYNMGLRFDGCELSGEYAKMANERMEAVECQMRMTI